MLLLIGGVPRALGDAHLSSGATRFVFAVHGERNISKRVPHFPNLVLLDQGAVELAGISDFHLSEVIIVIHDFLIP